MLKGEKMTNEEMNSQANAMIKEYGEAPALDLSKVKNLNANKAKGNNVSGIEAKVESQTNKARKSKFCFTEEHEIEIPTKGYLYQDAEDEDIKKGIVRMRPMSLSDEEIIANQTYIKNGTVFAHLLNSCILNNFDANELVPYDVYYLIYALRQITYGEDYEFEITCPNCEKKYNYTMKIADVDFETLETKETIVKEIKLPVSKYKLTMRNSKLGDEFEIYRMSKDSDYGEAVLGHVARTISIIDNKGEEVEKEDYADFFDAIPGQDRAEITKAFKNIEGMKIPTITCECPKCGFENITAIPFNKNFFRY